MREKYEIQLAQLNSSVLSMGKMIEVAIESTILALMGRDVEAAKTVHANDENIDNMERIGDHAVDIADLVLNLSDLKYSGMSEISEISSEIIGMIHDSIQSYIERDYNKAKDVIARDDLVDNLYHIIKKDLIEKIKKTEEGEQILDYFLIAKYFERIGDHAVNIAERVVFALTGKKE